MRRSVRKKIYDRQTGGWTDKKKLTGSFALQLNSLKPHIKHNINLEKSNEILYFKFNMCFH